MISITKEMQVGSFLLMTLDQDYIIQAEILSVNENSLSMRDISILQLTDNEDEQLGCIEWELQNGTEHYDLIDIYSKALDDDEIKEKYPEEFV